METKIARTFTITEKELNDVMYKVKKESELRVALDTYLAYQKIQLERLEKINKIAQHLKDIKQKQDVWFDNINDEELKEIIKKGWFKI